MNRQLFAKIISVLIVVNVLLNPLSVSLGQVNPTPVATSESHLNIENSAADSNTAALTTTPEGISTDSAQLNNTGDNSSIINQLNEANTVTNINNNDTDLNKQVQDSNITGQNNANDNVSLGQGAATSITTGAANTADTLSTVVNTNIIATQAQIVLTNIVSPQNQDLDLSSVSPCNNNTAIVYPGSLDVKNSGNNVTLLSDLLTKDNLYLKNLNQANLDQSANLTAITGQNQAEKNIGVTAIDTGSATNNLNSSLIANTNLVGNCWFFGVINLFNQMHGDIILPYELPIINHNSSSLLTPTNQTAYKTNYNFIVNNSNQVSLDTAVKTDANTGANNLTDTIEFGFQPRVTTGDAVSITNQYDLVNTNITGNRFLLLRINRYASWYGSVVGWNNPILATPDYLLLIFDNDGKISRQLILDPSLVSGLADQLGNSNTINSGNSVLVSPNSESARSLVIDNINSANINNNFSLLADTGNNSVGRFNPEILTGNATNHANVFNMVNTNVTGDNWFFGVVNIFADFFGNIVFPRADLVVTKYADKPQATPGETIVYKIQIENKGQINAQDVVITDILPVGAEFVSASDNGIYESGKIIWQFDEIKKKTGHDIYVTVKIGSQTNAGDFTNSAVATTATEEVNKIDNSATNVVSVKNPDSSSFLSASSNSNNQLNSSINPGSVAESSNSHLQNKRGKTLGSNNERWFNSEPVNNPRPTIKQSVQQLWQEMLNRMIDNWQFLAKVLSSRDQAIVQKIRQKLLQWFFVAVPKYILRS